MRSSSPGRLSWSVLAVTMDVGRKISKTECVGPEQGEVIETEVVTG